MSTPPRPPSFSALDGMRSRARGAHLRRLAASGPDPVALMQLTERVVDDVASVVVLDAEAYATPKPFSAYEGLFLDQYWSNVADLDCEYPTSTLSRAEERGAMSLEQLASRVLPRIMEEEHLLHHNHPFTLPVPDGKGGTLEFSGRLARVGRHRRTQAIRLYRWRIAEGDRLDWMAYIRHQKEGIAAAWLQDFYPDSEIRVVTANLSSGVMREATWSAPEIRGLLIMLQAEVRRGERPGEDLGHRRISAEWN